MVKNKKRTGDSLFYIANDIILFVALMLVLFPLIYIFSASLSSPNAVVAGKVWLFPVGFSLEGYKAVFRHNLIMSGYANTILYTVSGTFLNVGMTVLAAYPLSRKGLPGRNLIMFVFSFTMLFSGGLIPTYLLIKSLGLLNNRMVMILPNAIGVWNLIITRTFFQSSIPDELYEATKIDGGSDILFLKKIVLPLSKAVIAVITLFYGVQHWNAFFDAFIYLDQKEKFPLQIILREILILNSLSGEMMQMDPELLEKMRGLSELLRFSLIIVASLPVWIIYPFIQKQFVKGVMVGSIKG